MFPTGSLPLDEPGLDVVLERERDAKIADINHFGRQYLLITKDLQRPACELQLQLLRVARVARMSQ